MTYQNTRIRIITGYSITSDGYSIINVIISDYSDQRNITRKVHYSMEATLCELTKWKRVRALRPPPPLLGAHTMDIHTRNEGSPVEVPLRRTACRDPDRDRWWMLDGGVVGDHCIADSRLANFKQTFSSLKFCSRDSVLAKVSASSRKWSLVGVRSGSSDLT